MSESFTVYFVKELFCYCADISTPRNMTRHKTKRDWLLYLSSHMASWAGLGHSKRPKFPDLQPSVWRSGYARLAATEQWKPVCGLTNHASLFVSLMGETRFGGCQKNITCPTVLCQWRDNGIRDVFMGWVSPLLPMKRNLNASAYQ